MAIDRTASDFDNANQKVKKIKRLIDKGEYDAEIASYIPGTLDLVFQGMLDKITTSEQPAHLSYKDKETLDFQLFLDKNQYINLNSLHTCFRKLTNPAQDLADDINFIAHWIKEINIMKHGTNKQLVPTTTPLEIYQYSDAMLKHLRCKC